MAEREQTGKSLLARLRATEVPSAWHWPGHPEVPLKIRTLSNDEILDCRAGAAGELKKRGVPIDDLRYVDALEEETLTQLVFRAARDHEDPRKPFALSVEDVRENSTPAERAALFRVFEEHQRRYNPDPEQLEPGDVDALVAEVKKKGATALRSLGRARLESLLLTTVARLLSSPIGRSESGSES